MATVAISALVTNCSAQKSAESAPGLSYEDLAPGAQRAVEVQWLTALERSSPAVRARDLYTGRGVRRMQRLADSLGAQLFVASAGLGLVSGEDKVPSYDLSASGSTESAVQGRVLDSFSPRDWWASLQQSRYATRIGDVFARKAGLVLVAISNAYVPLLVDELAGLEQALRLRLRLFGAVDSKYPADLRHLLMPYDARLDALIRGSKVDFAQRAAEHFVTSMSTNTSFPNAIEEQRSWVKSNLDAVVVKPVEKRQAVDDERIRQLARKLAKQGLSHTKALAVLRQQHGIACEQSRFRRLFLEATG